AIGVSRAMTNYRENIGKKVESLQGPLSHVLGRVQEMTREVKQSASEASPPPPSGTVKVQVVDQGVDPLKIAGGAASLVRMAFVSFLVLLFVLIYRSEIADRAVRLLGRDPADLTTQTIRDSAASVSRYLSTQA